MFFLRQLKKFNLPQTLMIQFYTAIMESILTASITIWFGSSTSQERTKLQRIIRTAERIIGCNLPSLQQIYTSRFAETPAKLLSGTVKEELIRKLLEWALYGGNTCMNDYRPIALTPIVMKCFERLILSHIKRSLPSTLDPHQFAYRANRSTDDAVSLAIHTALNHLDSTNSYVRMLFIDFSSAFNTIIPSRLIHKLSTLGISSTLCSWIMDFLSCRPQCVRMGEHTSPSLTLSTGCPQGIVLSPLLYTLYTHDCTTTYSSNTIIKFANDTTIIGNITNDDEGPYREEVKLLTEWCAANNLSLNVSKTKELIIDFRKGGRMHTPLNIGGTLVERVSSFKFLCVHLAEDLTWTTNTSHLVRKAQQRLHFLRRLRRVNLPQQLLCNFYRSTVESILTSCITVWYGSATSAERKALQRVVKTAQHITASTLPPIQDIYDKRCLRKAAHISSDPTHPSHPLFQPLPSGK
ncbi:hypothetical protein NFI96_005649, partial [Prochilodus magdalenae]